MIDWWWIGNERVKFTENDKMYYNRLVSFIPAMGEIESTYLAFRMEFGEDLCDWRKTKSFSIETSSYFQRMCQLALSRHDAEFGPTYGLVRGKGIS